MLLLWLIAKAIRREVSGEPMSVEPTGRKRENPRFEPMTINTDHIAWIGRYPDLRRH